MKSEKGAEMFVYKLLQVMPDWHSRLVRPFKEKLNGEMSLETYYCLQTLRMCECEFVERVQHAEDRRSVCIRLTPKAVAYLDSYYTKNRAFIESLEEQLTEEDIMRLNQAVGILSDILPKLR